MWMFVCLSVCVYPHVLVLALATTESLLGRFRHLRISLCLIVCILPLTLLNEDPVSQKPQGRINPAKTKSSGDPLESVAKRLKGKQGWMLAFGFRA